MHTYKGPQMLNLRQSITQPLSFLSHLSFCTHSLPFFLDALEVTLRFKTMCEPSSTILVTRMHGKGLKGRYQYQEGHWAYSRPSLDIWQWELE